MTVVSLSAVYETSAAQGDALFEQYRSSGVTALIGKDDIVSPSFEDGEDIFIAVHDQTIVGGLHTGILEVPSLGLVAMQACEWGDDDIDRDALFLLMSTALEEEMLRRYDGEVVAVVAEDLRAEVAVQSSISSTELRRMGALGFCRIGTDTGTISFVKPDVAHPMGDDRFDLLIKPLHSVATERGVTREQLVSLVEEVIEVHANVPDGWRDFLLVRFMIDHVEAWYPFVSITVA
jgi:hypothetical protein